MALTTTYGVNNKTKISVLAHLLSSACIEIDCLICLIIGLDDSAVLGPVKVCDGR